MVHLAIQFGLPVGVIPDQVLDTVLLPEAVLLYRLYELNSRESREFIEDDFPTV